MAETKNKSSWLDRPIFSFFPILNGEMLLFILIVLLTAVSRLYDLGARVMSHDESLHVYFSWLFSQGQGFQHTPLMHGPLQFHLLALTYFLFGSSDFTARLPHALAGILTVILLWKWRRYLGRAGTLVAAGLMLISPFMLYYGRYARNEAFVALFGVMTLYAILRYFETGKARHLILLTVATALHFTSKETTFIYTAQAMLFLAICLVNRLTRIPWKNGKLLNGFVIAISTGIILAGLTLGLTFYNRFQGGTDASQTAAPVVPGQAAEASPLLFGHLPSVSLLAAATIVAFIVAAVFLVIGYGWEKLRRERSFDMLLLLGTFVLPQLAAFPVKALGWDPLAYQFTWPGWDLPALWAQGPVRTAAILLLLVALTIAIGLLWDRKRWLLLSVIFWGIYVFFYTSVFTNWEGIATGMVGSLGYWLVQQGVQRGSQPWYYYLLIQIPLYEFLPALGLGLAAWFGLRRKSPASLPGNGNAAPQPDPEPAPPAEELPLAETNLTFPLLVWWALTSLLAYTLAGEKMPWLTVHITLPLILLTGWCLGQVIERLNWATFRKQRGGLAALLLVVFFISFSGALVAILGTNPPFQGKTLEQLAATNTFLLSAILTLVSVGGLSYVLSGWRVRDTLRVATLALFGLLAVLTVRTSVRAAFVNADNAAEYLVYAHGARGIKDVMEQVDAISAQTAGGYTLEVAYDANLPKQGISWPFKWYLRNYPNAVSFDKPDASLGGKPVIIVDQNNFARIKPIVGSNYYRLDYLRMVWPNQDYFSLTWPRIKEAITNPAMRESLIQIWLNRDYSVYAQAKNETSLTPSTWEPSDKMQLYIRKDIAAQMWEYGIPQGTNSTADSYEQGEIVLASDLVVDSLGEANGQLNAPRGVTAAADDSLYVADSRNNRILHLDTDGAVLQAWGEASPGCPYDSVPPPDVPPGTFCEPWAIAVSPDGQWIYVADTWNHRIQKLSADGAPVKAWGYANYDPISSDAFGLWGPRGIAVDAQGRVFVADTGNKRIVVYDADGNFVAQFGGGGLGAGKLEEPVGLVFDAQGNLYVADTWNQRIQVFTPDSDGLVYTPTAQWVVSGWSAESLDNKPYLAVDRLGHIFATDPEAYRVLEFNTDGTFILTWGDFGAGPENFGLVSGIAVDSQGRVWVSDTANDRLMRFTLP